MENFILTISLLVIGIVLRRMKDFPENSSHTLNMFVIYVSLPALVLIKVPELKFSFGLLATAIMPWVMLIISAGLVLFFSKILNWTREITGALMLIVPLGNTSFLGLPMVRAYFGDSAIPFALMYDQLGSFLALAIYGSLVIAIYAKTQQKLTVGSVLMKVLVFPPFISLIIALALYTTELPAMYFNVLTPIAETLVPVVMIAVGFQLSLKLELDKLKPFLVGLSIKMIIAPALALLIFMLLGLKGMVYQVTVFEVAMPPMISAGALAIITNLSPKLTAAMVAYGIMLSFVTLPLIYYIVNNVL